MGLTPRAVLLELNTLRIVLLVLVGRIVTTLALGASQGDHCTHRTGSSYETAPS